MPRNKRYQQSELVSELEESTASEDYDSEDEEENEEEEFDDEISQIVYQELKPLTKRNYKSTLNVAALMLLILHIGLTTVSGIVIYKEPTSIYWMFYNFTYASNAAGIICTILLFGVLITVTVWTSMPRRLIIVAAVIEMICAVYLYFLIFGILSKNKVVGNLPSEFIIIQLMVFCCVLGNLVGVLAHKRIFPLWLSLLVSGVLFTPIIVLFMIDKVSTKEDLANVKNYQNIRVNFTVWRLILYYGLLGLINYYLTSDNYFITRFRGNIYKVADSPMIFFHYQTDFTFRFWRDIRVLSVMYQNAQNKSIPESNIIIRSGNSSKTNRSKRTRTNNSKPPNL